MELLIQLLIEVNGPPCPIICRDALRNDLIDNFIGSCSNLNPVGRRITINVTDIQRDSCSPDISPSCPTTTTVITQYLSITPTNCLQSTHTKEMSTTVGTGNTHTATGDTNSSLMIFVALIGLLAAALVVVVTGWIVSCVYLQRKTNK